MCGNGGILGGVGAALFGAGPQINVDDIDSPGLKASRKTLTKLQDLAFARLEERMAELAEIDAANRELLETTLGITLPVATAYTEFGAGQLGRYTGTFAPVEDRMAAISMEYASPARQELEAARAAEDVMAAGDAALESSRRALESYGLDPSDTRYTGLDQTARVLTGVTAAQAGNEARRDTEARGFGMLGAAANVGQNTAKLGADVGAIGSDTAQRNQLLALDTARVGGSLSGTPGEWAGVTSTAAGNLASQELGRHGIAANLLQYDPALMAGGLLAAGAGAGLGAYMGSGGGGAEGGAIYAPGGPTDDAGHLMVSDGEYIVPAALVRKKGTDFFDRLVEKELGYTPGPKEAIPTRRV